MMHLRISINWGRSGREQGSKASLSSAATKGLRIESLSLCGTCSGVCACVPSLMIKKDFNTQRNKVRESLGRALKSDSSWSSGPGFKSRES